MGYRKVPTIHTLEFKQFEGLQVRVKNIKIGRMRKLLSVMESSDKGVDDVVDAMASELSDNLVSWTLEDEDGNPLPASREEIDDLEFPMLSDIISEWLESMTGPSEDLGKDSSSGGKFPGQPLTMEAL